MTKKKDIKPVIRKFKSQLYPITLYFILHSDEKTRKKFGYTDNFENESAVTCSNGKDIAIIISEKLLNGPAEVLIGTIVHECFHMTADVMYDIGEKLSVDHQEPWAYLIMKRLECANEKLPEKQKEIGIERIKGLFIEEAAISGLNFMLINTEYDFDETVDSLVNFIEEYEGEQK